ncbi:MAG: choice-of-anchor I family protein [Bacteroidia bacterium]|nr:choice-of-anchor I family protein [Bacteroidia bacterium]
MKISTQVIILVLMIATSLSAFGQSKVLNFVSTYDAGSFDEGAAEIVAYYGNRLFLTNAENDALDIIDITDPFKPTLIRSIDITTYGEGLNSVATSSSGNVAMAIEGMDQMPGKIVVLDTAGALIAEYAAGVLPDMVTFTPDGNYIISANEGEPNDDYDVDPEGSITVVDISGGAATGVVSQITLTAWNDQKYSLINAGVRIFGVDSTNSDLIANVANDLEPEYVTVDPNSDSIAYVVCQENNAMIVIDYKNAVAVDILPFGFKDHSTGTATLQEFRINDLPNLPTLGTPVYGGGQPTVKLGGFSGLWYDAARSTSTNAVFYAIPDRGPNDGAVNRSTLTRPMAKNLRPFKLPDYQARIVKFSVDLTTNTLTLDSADQIFLTAPDGVTPISGRGNIPTIDEVPVTYTDPNTPYNDSSFFDGTTYYHQLPYDPYGGDFEGIFRAPGSGNYFMVDEYRPAIYAFNSTGVMLARYIPGAIGKEIFFSEYAEGSSNNKYLEIYNPTDSTIDFNNYLLVNCSNGCNVAGEWDFDNTALIANKTLAPGEVFVIAHPSAQADILAQADTTFQFLSNGDDWYGIVRASDSSIVDQVGEFSVTDPGSGWDVAGVPAGTRDQTLIRKRFVTKGNADWNIAASGDSINSEWIVEIRPTADTVLATLGSHEADYTEYAIDNLGTNGLTLPAVYNNRRANRGFEAIALDTDRIRIAAFIQTPMDNPNSGVRHSDVVRILMVNGGGVPVAEYVYLLEQNSRSRFGISRVDKIGDAVYIGNDKYWVLERDSSNPDEEEGKKYVFEIDLSGATNILGTELSNRTEGATLESMSADELAAMGIRPAAKRKVVNLPSIGYLASDKPEGLALIPGVGMAVLNDNDFGLAGAGVSDNSILGIICFGDNYSLDASNRDDSIRFENWNVFGMYQPDATKAYDFNGDTYIFTANEGDARDYDGFSEEERAGDLDLDPVAFPDFANLQMDENLGRINTTTTLGDLDGDDDYDEIYVYGARSFSIWDKYGNQVWDSGNDFGKIVADSVPAHFNSTNDDNDSFDNRSDDKGTEPEAIELGTVDGTVYAFIGLERMGGIMVYDVTDPKAPVFVEYELNRDFNFPADTSAAGDLAPEDIKFITGDDSPVPGTAMIAVANEVSGTVTLYSVGDKLSINVEEEVETNTPLVVYPNPVNGSQLFFNKVGNYTIFNMVGQQVATVENAKNVNVSSLKPGVYVIRSDKNEATRFVKK